MRGITGAGSGYINSYSEYLDDAVDLLHRHGLQAWPRKDYISGARRIERLEGPENLVRRHDPYLISSEDDTWFAIFYAGQRALPIKASKSVEDVAWAVINTFNLFDKLFDSMQMFLSALHKLLLNNLITEIVSQTDIAVYAIEIQSDDYVKEYALALTSIAFRENALVAVIQTTDQGLAVRFEPSDQASPPETVPNMEAAANRIIERHNQAT